MIVTYANARRVFQKVKLVREEYRQKALNGDANVISIEDLKSVVADMYQLEIKMTQVAFEGSFVRGLYERYKERVVIRVRHNQGEDFMRFTAAKEMCHAVIDAEEDWSVKGVDTLEAVLTEYALLEGDASAPATQSEMFAEIAAIELLYPYDVRVTDLAKLDLGQTTMVKIAGEQKLPQSIVARALSPSHHAFATKWWGEVNKPAVAA